jgi:hypothetical protein
LLLAKLRKRLTATLTKAAIVCKKQTKRCQTLNVWQTRKHLNRNLERMAIFCESKIRDVKHAVFDIGTLKTEYHNKPRILR